MNKKAIRTVPLFLLFLLSLTCFSYTLVSDWESSSMDLLYLFMRIAGYLLSLSSILLIFILEEKKKKGKDTKKLMGSLLWMEALFLFLLLVNDIALYIEYGLNIGSLYDMVAYFVLDGLLIAFEVIFLLLDYYGKRMRAVPLYFLGLISISLWLVYIAGDLMGYDLSLFQEWDEAIMKMPIALIFLIYAFSDKKEERGNQ